MTTNNRPQSNLGIPVLLSASLGILSIITVFAGVAAALLILTLDMDHNRLSWQSATWAMLALLGGCYAGLPLAVLAWLCRANFAQTLLQQRIAASLEYLTRVARLPGVAAPAEPAESESGAPSPAILGIAGNGAGANANIGQALLDELRELNVNLLLTDAQRQAKRQIVSGHQADNLAQQTQQALSAGELPAANEALDALSRLAPDHPQLEPLRQSILEARMGGQAHDLEQAGYLADDLMAAGQFDQAESAAQRLLDRYPGFDHALALLERVRRERDRFVAEHRARLYKQVETEAHGRRWRAALAAALKLLEAYPDSHEADRVRVRMATINDNAQIEEVRERRDYILDLINRRRFAEAITAAREVIHKFPGTAAADELRAQMPRLEEFAKAQKDGK